MTVLSEKMQDALNGQLNAELYSGYLYLSMSAHYESIDMPGFASWMRAQRLEELVHALKFFDYVAENGRVLLKAIDAPPTEWDGVLGPFEAALAHEKKVTGLINDLVRVAEDEGDDATREFLQWYVKEQAEEEETAEKIVDKIKQAGDSEEELQKLDGELAQRT
jgi:ferritin